MSALDELARRCIGVPFLDHGRDPAGWDCWGLARWMCRETGLGAFPDFGEAYRRVGGRGLAEIAAAIDANLGAWRRLKMPAACSVLVFRRRRRAYHVGFALDRRRMLHVTQEMAGGTTIEHFDTLVWGSFLDGAYVPRKGGE